MRVERFQLSIKQILNDGKFHSVNEIVTKTNGSPASIRRHLLKLEEDGFLVRLNGGAIIKDSSNIQNNYLSNIIKEKNKVKDEYVTNYLVNNHLDKEKNIKKEIGYAAAHCIHDGDVIFIGSSSTTFYMIDYIVAKDITVLTDGYPHLLKLIDKKIKTYMLEGYLNEDRGLIMYTDDAINKLASNFHFHKVFLGTVGVDANAGYTTESLRDANLKKVQKYTGDNLYILADSSKFNYRKLVGFATLEEATLITEKQPPFPVHDLIIASEVKHNV